MFQKQFYLNSLETLLILMPRGRWWIRYLSMIKSQSCNDLAWLLLAWLEASCFMLAVSTNLLQHHQLLVPRVSNMASGLSTPLLVFHTLPQHIEVLVQRSCWWSSQIFIQFHIWLKCSTQLYLSSSKQVDCMHYASLCENNLLLLNLKLDYSS